MRVGIEQRLVLVLAVQVHQRQDRLPQAPGRRQGAVEKRAAAALRGHLTAGDDLVPVRRFEDRLNGGAFLTGAHQVGRRAPADEQADGFDEDRLPRPGFTREHVQAGREFEVEAIDDGEVLDGEKPQHVAR